MIRFLALLALALLALAAPLQAATTLITGARVFDGTGKPAEVRDVLIRDDRIVAVADRITLVPPYTVVVNAKGLTLLPGLHDLHTHIVEDIESTRGVLEQRYAPYLAAGVTTVVNFSVGRDVIALLQRLGPETRLPNVRRALRLGVPGGHGTESPRTRAITTLVTTPAEARSAMPGLIALKPDLFKVFADGWRYGDPARPDKPDMDLPTLSAIVADAHAAGIEVVTHTVSAKGARIAADARVDAIVHGIGDARLDAATIRRIKARGTAYVPTLVVYEPQATRSFLPQEWAMLRPADRAREEARSNRPSEPIAEWDARRWQIMQDNVRALHAAGVRIGVGTDAGIGGVYHGWATIREIRWLVRLGLSPAQALHAATGASAAIMGGTRDYGGIAKGQRADLILTGGKPDLTIDDLYDVRRVFVAGKDIDLAAARAMRSADTPPAVEPTGH